jgi:hypothetical protein
MSNRATSRCRAGEVGVVRAPAARQPAACEEGKQTTFDTDFPNATALWKQG